MEHLRRLLAPILSRARFAKKLRFFLQTVPYQLIGQVQIYLPGLLGNHNWVKHESLGFERQNRVGENFQHEKVVLFWETGFQHLRTQFSSSSKYDHSGQSHLNIKYQSKLPELFNSISNLEMIAFNYPLRSSPSSIRSWQRL